LLSLLVQFSEVFVHTPRQLNVSCTGVAATIAPDIEDIREMRNGKGIEDEKSQLYTSKKANAVQL